MTLVAVLLFILSCVSIAKVTPSPSALSESRHMQQLGLREMGQILQQEGHDAAAWLTLQ